MIRLAVDTKLGREQVMERARAHFAGRLGLTPQQVSDCCVSYTGGGGHVSVSFEDGAPANRTRVVVESQEWDEDAKAFAAGIS